MSAQSDTLCGVVRHPLAGEWLSEEFSKLPNADFSWVWVYEDEQGLVGYLMTCPCHGAVMLLRAKAIRTDAPKAWLLRTIYSAAKECRERGYFYWVMPMSFSGKADEKVTRIAKKFGAAAGPAQTVVMLAGEIPCR